MLLLVLVGLAAPLPATAAEAGSALTLKDLLDGLHLSDGRRLRYEQVRVSGLLAEPLVTRGAIRYRRGHLRKTSVGPGGERLLVVEGDRVRVEGPDGSRTHALDRMPAMRLLMRTLQAVAEADGELLRERYDAQLSGGRQAWVLEMRAPGEMPGLRHERDRRHAGRPASIRLSGGRQIRRIRLESPALGRIEITLEDARD